MLSQWVDGFFCAAHKGGDGRLHGHTWRVRVFWDYAGADILVQQAKLREALSYLDHSELPENLSRAEDIAADIGRGLFAQRVEIWREAEGLGATWTA